MCKEMSSAWFRTPCSECANRSRLGVLISWIIFYFVSISAPHQHRFHTDFTSSSHRFHSDGLQREIAIWGCWGLGFLFESNINNRVAQVLRRIVLFLFRLVTCRFAYRRALKPNMSMISGLLNVSLSPKRIYFIFGDPRYLKKTRKAPNQFLDILELFI